MGIQDHTVTMESVDPTTIPERPTPRYAEILSEFTNSGSDAVRLNLWEDANPATVSTGLRSAATKAGFEVSVVVRKGEVYLIRL